MTTAQSTRLLPAALAPWSEGLSVLTPALALAIGPLVRRIDTLITEREPRTARSGEPDGYGGLTRRGALDQLRPSEWLLADELPEEFLRRLTSRELLYTAPEFRDLGARGRVVVLVDTGPGAAGAARLVQLAALVVLHRRAAARGAELVVGVLGDPPDDWLTGELPELLPRWLDARRDTEPDAAAVARARAALDAPDEAWLLTTPVLAAELPGSRRTLTADPCGWSAAGATRVRLALGPAVAELPLPAPDLAVRALRGAEFRRAAQRVPMAVGGVRLPVFNSTLPILLARGKTADHLVTTKLNGATRQPGRPRTHGFGYPVVAAASVGRRLIALVKAADRLELRSIGRPLGPAPWPGVDLGRTALDLPDLNALLAGPVLPLTFEDGLVSVPLAGRWWSFSATGELRDDGPAGTPADDPTAFSWAREPRLFGGELPSEVAAAERLVFAKHAVAWSPDGEQWQVLLRDGTRTRLVVPDGAEVIGLVHHGPTVALITCSTAGVLLRSVRPESTRTLSRLSGGTTRPVVHPSLPLIVTEPAPGRVLVGDALTGQIHLTVRSAT
ncbi:hypothetical protein C7C46_07290 [Streptomyces tateyamensis]|uniref:Uncharacterized protein n=1 Tax=Streptomyces tateyamensis TaxID=565073 RepID=A0A2V4PKG5_9ACTN|nr:hypothetical protein [Streptomyces tateyamensis]PYC84709.1 hypothetical protein C7C46_07290 [Streptomyces tateyamensis]